MDSHSTANSLAPIHSLPPELLDEIILLCIPSDPHQYRPKSTLAPQSVSLVCQHWRERAMSIPKLWSKIYVQLAVPSQQQDLEWVDSWLSRSGSSPLFLWLVVSHPSSIYDVLLLFLQAHSRWKAFHFECLESDLPASLPSIPSGGFGWLELASINITRQIEEFFWAWFRPIIESAPRLRKLWTSKRDPSIPWHILVGIGLYCRAITSVTDCYSIFSRSSQLKTARISITSASTLKPSSLLRCNLTRLYLITFFSIDPLLDSLRMPLLQYLSIGCYDAGMVVSCSNFLAFLTRSSCSLKELELLQVQFDDKEIISCLEHPAIRNSLVELSLCGSLNIASLAVPTDPEIPCLVPNLKILKLRIPIYCEQGVLSEAVMSRLDPALNPERASRLRTLRLGFASTLLRQQFKFDIVRLNDLRKAGMGFSLGIWIYKPIMIPSSYFAQL